MTRWRRGGRDVDGRVSAEDRILLRRAGTKDIVRHYLAAGDAEAQRWLGWDMSSPLVPEHEERYVREFLRGGDPGPLHTDERGNTHLAALIGTNYIGGASLEAVLGDAPSAVADPGSVTIGGVIVPELRGRGLGSRLFALATRFAHDNLGVQRVVAVCEAGNEASRRALLNAGYLPVSGPSEHQLPDGRVIPSLWFAHTA